VAEPKCVCEVNLNVDRSTVLPLFFPDTVMASYPVCKGVKKNGAPCSYLGKHEGYCKLHRSNDCPICYERMTSKNTTTTRCKHVYHTACLERWLTTKHTCPLCREKLMEQHPVRPTTGQLRLRMNSFTFVDGGVTYNFPGTFFTFNVEN